VDSLVGIAEFIKSVGFPIFVGAYVLIQMNATLRELTASLTKLGEAIHHLPCCLEKMK
jgi:hypothetical protein